MRLKCFFAVLFLTASLPLFSQVAPAATEGGLTLPLSIGAGVSDYNADSGPGHLYGGTLWIDYSLNRVPSFLQGIGLEVEARDIHFDPSPSATFLREDVAAGGVTYTWRRFRNFRPYAKLLGGLGNADYLISHDRRYNQSRTVTSMGGGFEYRVFRRVWVRADYEYQYWPDFFISTTSSGALDPQGFTFGAMYHFSR